MDQPTPIAYPKITVPGRGEFEVKFGLAAARIVDRELGLDGMQVLAHLREALPTEENGVRKPGHIRLDFLLTLLSACIWKQAHMTAEELADAFDEDGATMTAVPMIVVALINAISKTKWSAQTPGLTETATIPAESAAAKLN